MTGKGKLLLEALGEIDVKYISDWENNTDSLQSANETVEESINSDTYEKQITIIENTILKGGDFR